MSTLVLVRHGPSAYVPPTRAFDRLAVVAWREQYDALGLRPSAAPPAIVVERAARADLVIASDLPRAVQSAERLVPYGRVLVSPLLRETPLPIPAWPTRLPLGVWGALIYLRWKLRAASSSALPDGERERVGEAARYLVSMLGAGGTTLVVTHGVFRALLTDTLRTTGWRVVERRGGYGHWSAWTLQRRRFVTAGPPFVTRRDEPRHEPRA